MNKNTILAVILSTLVVIGAFVFQSLTSSKNSNQLSSSSIEKTENSEISTENKNSEELKEKTLDEEKFLIQVIDENQAELEPFTIETEKAFITLTNKGGDIISYELKEPSVTGMVSVTKVKVTKAVKVVVAKKGTLKRRKTHQKSLIGLRTA